MDREYYIVIKESGGVDGKPLSYFGLMPDFTLSTTNDSYGDARSHLKSLAESYIENAVKIGRKVPLATPKHIVASKWEGYTVDSILLKI